MSRAELPLPDRKPLIALVERANRALQADMVRRAHATGHVEVKQAHNLVFGTLRRDNVRAADMAARAGITRQSMGEVIRDLVGLGILEMHADPDDGRAKVVSYTDRGVAVAGDLYRHLIELERRFEAEFGEHEYAVVRDVLDRLVGLLDRVAAEGTAQDSPSLGGKVG